MQSQISQHVSSTDRVVAACLAAFSMFVVGYTATRVFLVQPTSAEINETTVIPNQAEMWKVLGK